MKEKPIFIIEVVDCKIKGWDKEKLLKHIIDNFNVYHIKKKDIYGVNIGLPTDQYHFRFVEIPTTSTIFLNEEFENYDRKFGKIELVSRFEINDKPAFTINLYFNIPNMTHPNYVLWQWRYNYEIVIFETINDKKKDLKCDKDYMLIGGVNNEFYEYYDEKNEKGNEDGKVNL